MEFNKCSRCGSFYVSQGNVCPKCQSKDTLEFSTLRHTLKKTDLERILKKFQVQLEYL